MDAMKPGALLSTPQIQDLLFGALCVFDDMCATASIPYWLDGGTLLGAYREQDLIAWDDDIDVCTEESSLDRLVEFSDLLPDHLTLEVSTGGSGPSARLLLTQTSAVEKIAQHGIGESATHLFIDIFTVQPAHSPLRHRVAARAGKLARLAPVSQEILTSSLPMSPRERAVWKLASLTPRQALNIAERLGRPPALPTGYSTYSYHLATPDFRLPDTDFWPLGRAELRGRWFPAPRNSEGYLRTLYGRDFMTPPPPAGRLAHLEYARWAPDSD